MPKSKRKLDKESSSDEDNEVAKKKIRKGSRWNVTSVPAETSKKKIKPNEKGASFPQTSKLPSWNEADLLSGTYNTSPGTMMNIVKLFQEDNTIPFICRYRKELIGNISPDMMRDIKASYNQLLKLKTKKEAVIVKLEKINGLTDELHRNILAVKSSDELDHLYEPFKTASKASLSEKAKSKGLQDPAEKILFGRGIVNLNDFVDAANGLEDIQSVRDGLKHIILNLINKDVDVLEEIRRLLKSKYHSYKFHPNKTIKVIQKRSHKSIKQSDQNVHKFELYYDFCKPIEMVKPHQTLAINRGESLKILKVTIDIPETCKRALYNFLYKKYYLDQGVSYSDREEVLKVSFNEFIAKKLQPLITRRVRKDLTKSAEKASIDVFCNELKAIIASGTS